jgi:hypothetical protein
LNPLSADSGETQEAAGLIAALSSATKNLPVELSSRLESLIAGKLSSLTGKAYRHDAQLFIKWLFLSHSFQKRVNP